MEQLLIEADEAWALYDAEESRYCWCNPAEPSDPWTLFALHPGPYHGTLRLNDEEIAVRVIPDNNHYLVHCRNQNLGLYRQAFHTRFPLDWC